MPHLTEVRERRFEWDDTFTTHDIRRNADRVARPALVIKHRGGLLVSWRLEDMPPLHGTAEDNPPAEGAEGSPLTNGMLDATSETIDILIEAQTIVAQVLSGIL